MLTLFMTDRIRRSANVNKVPGRATIIGSQAVAQVEPPLTELARSARLFHGGISALAGGIAPVQAVPTTAAAIALANIDVAGGRSIVFDLLSFFLASGTPAAGATLLVAIGALTQATMPTPSTPQAANWAIGPTRGKDAASIARWVATAVFAGAPAWVPVNSTFQAAAANVGQGDNPQEVRGGILVPPGYAAGFAILSGAGTTPLYGIGGRWGEVELDVE